MQTSHASQSWLVSFGAAVPMIILPVVILTIPVTIASQVALTSEQLSSWIIVLYGVPSVLGIALSYRYQQPLLFTGNVFIMIFFASLGGEHRYSDFVGAALLAGIAMAITSALGLTNWLSRCIPPPIVLGLLAGAVLPYVVDIFSMLNDEPAMIGGTVLAYFGGQRLLSSRIPAILPALVAGIIIAAFTGKIGDLPDTIPLPSLVVIWPTANLESIAAITPILLILLTLQSNVPSMVFLRTQGYSPPERHLNIISGIGTAIGSLAGPTGISLSLPATSIVSGPDAGDRHYRHRAVYISGGAVLVLALFSGVAAHLTAILPLSLMLTIAGLAIVGVLAHALRQITSGPLTLGPLMAFAVSLSDMSLLGFGSFFWGLAIGTAVSMIIEREALQAMHAADRQ